MRFAFSKPAAKAAGRNGGKAKNAGFWHYVDGQPIKLADIAATLGVSLTTAKKRVKAARMAGALTWSALRRPECSE